MQTQIRTNIKIARDLARKSKQELGNCSAGIALSCFRSASPGLGNQQVNQEQNFFINGFHNSSNNGVTGNKSKVPQSETTQKINAAIFSAKGYFGK